MTDSFDPLAYVSYLRRHAWPALGAVAAATALTLGVSLLLPERYTATATLVIEPPSANDPRAATAVSSVYLESLKAYEQFAASDSLFARACDKFGLLAGPEPPPVETFKRRVLRVSKVKDTKLLRISVTLPDPKIAHDVARYLAEETVALNRSIARDGDRSLLTDMDAQLTGVREKLTAARTEYARVTASGSDRLLNEELHTLADLKSRASVELVSARAALAEAKAIGDTDEAAAIQARLDALNVEIARIDRETIAKAAQLSAFRAGQDEAAEALRIAEESFNVWSRNTTSLASSAASRTEQLRVVDPGIVPQQPSYPNPPLFALVALVLATMLTIGWLTLRFGLQSPQPQAPATEPVRVIRGAR